MRVSISRSEFHNRIKRVQKAMELEGIGALIAYSYKGGAVQYLTNYSPRISVTNAGLVVLPLDGSPFLITRLPQYLSAIKRDAIAQHISISISNQFGVGSVESMVLACKSVLSDLRLLNSKLGLVGYGPELGIEATLRNQFSRSKIINANRLLENLRSIKSSNELDLVRRSAEIARNAFESASSLIRVGGNEQEVAAEADYQMKRRGVEYSFVFFGTSKNANRHYNRPRDRRIVNRDNAFLEVIPFYKGYSTELVSSKRVGKVPPSLMRLYETSIASLKHVAETLKPGMPISEISKSINSSVRSAGFANFSSYRLGHGMGLDNIENPEFLSDKDSSLVKPGMVLAIHPNLSVPKIGEICVGGTFVIENKRARPLLNLDYDFLGSNS